MNKYFKMIHTGGPYQDTTSSYCLDINTDANIDNIIGQIVNENDWGTITLWTIDPNLKDVQYLADNEKFTNIIIKYSDRKIEFKQGYDLYLNMNKIVPCNDKHIARGSYGNMNFIIYME